MDDDQSAAYDVKGTYDLATQGTGRALLVNNGGQTFLLHVYLHSAADRCLVQGWATPTG